MASLSFPIFSRLGLQVLNGPVAYQGYNAYKEFSSDLPIGELLVKAGLVSQKQVDDAVKDSGSRDRLIGRTLIMRGLLSHDQLRAALQAQSLLRDGAIDAFRAFKALSAASTSGLSFDDALSNINSLTEGGITTVLLKIQDETCKLGELLLAAGKVSTAQLKLASEETYNSGDPLGVYLVGKGILTESYIDAALELQIRVRDGMVTREQAIEALSQDPRKFLEMISPHLNELNSPSLQLPTSDKPSVIRLGELFVRAGILVQDDIAQALELALAHGHPIGEMLVARGFITNALLDAALSLQRMVKHEQLSTGEATACLVKVFNSDKTVSECILELNFLKAKPVERPAQGAGDSSKEVAGYFKRASRAASRPADRTVADLPAMSPVRQPQETSSEKPDALKDFEALKNLDLSKIDFDQLELSKQADFHYKQLFKPSHPYTNLNAEQKSERRQFADALHDVYSRLGRIFLKRSEYLQAEEMLEESYGLTQTYYLDSNKLLDLSLLACHHIKIGKSWQAERILKRCIALCESDEETNSPDYKARRDALIGLTYHRLALVYCHLGLLFKAEKHFKKAAELLQTASLQGYVLLSANSSDDEEMANDFERTTDTCSLGSLLKKRLAAVYKDHGVLLNRMRRESEAERYYLLSRKTLAEAQR